MSILDDISAELEDIKAQSLWKTERPILSPQWSRIEVAPGREVLNFCANNYLGLADNPDLIEAAKEALDSHGLGMASVRFICGTTDLHRMLERRIADYVEAGGCDPLCRLLRRQWRRVRAACSARRMRSSPTASTMPRSSTASGCRRPSAIATPMATWTISKRQLTEARQGGARRIIVVTDGVFSMDGYFAKLEGNPGARRPVRGAGDGR